MRRASVCDADVLLGNPTKKACPRQTSHPIGPWWRRRIYLTSFSLTRMNNGSESPPFDGAGKWAARNLNSIMLFVVIGVLSFLSTVGWNNSITLAEMKGSIVTKTDLELKITTLKADVDIKIAEANTKTLALDKDLTALKLALAERGLTKPQR